MFNVLHLIPTLSGGGAERQLSMLAAEQSRRGWNVHVGIRRGGVHEDFLRASGVVIHLLGDHRGINPLLLFQINNIVKQIKPDFIQTWLPQMDIVGGIAALWNSVSLIISERTTGLGYKKIKLQAWVRCHLARYADAIVANSSTGVDYWNNITYIHRPIFQIANAIDVEAIRKAISMPRKVSKLIDDKHEILVVGRFNPDKGLETVIQSIKLIPESYNIHVSIIGEGPLHDEIEVLINVAGLHDRIALLPYLPSWWEKLKDTSVLISMSRYEGQPNVVIEAMAAGCPLIVSDIPAHRELLCEDSAMLVPLDDSAILAKTIVSFLSDSISANQRAELAMFRTNDFTIEIAADAYESVYEKVVKGNKY